MPLKAWEYQNNETSKEFTEGELTAAAGCLQGGRAAGPDGVPAEVVRIAVASNPAHILKVFNSLLKGGIFPTLWKQGRLALLPKASGNHSRKVRPICILNAISKLFEKMIKERLKDHATTTGALNDEQFSFRRKLSTVDAIHRVLQLAEFANSGSARRKDWSCL